MHTTTVSHCAAVRHTSSCCRQYRFTWSSRACVWPTPYGHHVPKTPRSREMSLSGKDTNPANGMASHCSPWADCRRFKADNGSVRGRVVDRGSVLGQRPLDSPCHLQVLRPADLLAAPLLLTRRLGLGRVRCLHGVRPGEQGLERGFSPLIALMIRGAARRNILSARATIHVRRSADRSAAPNRTNSMKWGVKARVWANLGRAVAREARDWTNIGPRMGSQSPDSDEYRPGRGPAKKHGFGRNSARQWRQRAHKAWIWTTIRPTGHLNVTTAVGPRTPSSTGPSVWASATTPRCNAEGQRDAMHTPRDGPRCTVLRRRLAGATASATWNMSKCHRGVQLLWVSIQVGMAGRRSPAEVGSQGPRLGP